MVRALIVFVILAAFAVLLLWRVDEPPATLRTELPMENMSAPNVEPVEYAAEPSVASEPAQLRTEPNILALISGRRMPDITVPPWADDMESTILSYVALHPNLALTGLQVQCANEGCTLLMMGTHVPAYDMNFDVFADEHGFNGALIGGDGRARTVFLRR